MLCKRFLLGLSLLALTGCGFLNPYHENFDCRMEDGGKCVDTMTAYADAVALEGSDNQPPTPSFNPQAVPGNPAGMPAGRTGEHAYREQLYSQLTDLIGAPETPMVTAPKIIRVLMLPYQAKEGELIMPRFIYVKAEEARWVMDGGLTEPSTY